MATVVPPTLNVTVAKAVTARTKTANVRDVIKSAGVPVSSKYLDLCIVMVFGNACLHHGLLDIS